MPTSLHNTSWWKIMESQSGRRLCWVINTTFGSSSHIIAFPKNCLGHLSSCCIIIQYSAGTAQIRVRISSCFNVYWSTATSLHQSSFAAMSLRYWNQNRADSSCWNGFIDHANAASLSRWFLIFILFDIHGDPAYPQSWYLLGGYRVSIRFSKSCIIRVFHAYSGGMGVQVNCWEVVYFGNENKHDRI